MKFTTYKHISLIFSLILLGVMEVSLPSLAIAQTKNPEVRELFEEGRKLVQARDYNGAIALYEQAAKIEPRNAIIYSGIGYLHAQQGNFTSALSAYRQAIALDNKNSDFYYAIGYVQANLGDTHEAKEAYRRAIQLNRNHLNAYLGLGVTQAKLGNFTAATWAYEEAIKLDPNNAQTYEFMANMYQQRGQFQRTRTLLNQALTLYNRANDYNGAKRVQDMLQELGS